MRFWLGAIIAATFFLVSGCAHVTNDDQALCFKADGCLYSPYYGYRFDPNKLGSDLIIVTFSGGGLRATALAYGTLRALAQIQAPSQPGKSLLDQVSVISSVSGGSVTAGWYALYGRNGLNQKDNSLQRFIQTGAQTELLVNGLNPIALARFAFTPYQRSDVLSDMFAKQLYGDSTYEKVAKLYDAGNQPFVILNATDMGHETRFPFTQNRFDLICSDLMQYRLADAVTASADFPPVFSAVGLSNFSGSKCPIAKNTSWQQGPQEWVMPILKGTTDKIVSNALLEVRAARDAQNYMCPDGFDSNADENKTICAGSSIPTRVYSDGRTLHLQDGGLADNLGIQSTLALEDSSSYGPGLYERLGVSNSVAAEPYKKVKRVLFIVVNARASDSPDIDKDVYPPSVISTALRIVDTSLDATILTTQDYLTAELQAIKARRQGDDSGSVISATSHDTSLSGATSKASQPRDFERLEVKIATVDFDMLIDRACRRAFASMPTSWSLKPRAVAALQNLPAFLLGQSQELKDFMGPTWQPSSKPGDIYNICRQAEGAEK